jgi:hypothetical protein
MSMVERLLRLWTEPVAETADAIAAFGAVYADPVSLNGVDVLLLVSSSGRAHCRGIRGSQRTIDVLSISADRISALHVVPDNLRLAMRLGAVALARRP